MYVPTYGVECFSYFTGASLGHYCFSLLVGMVITFILEGKGGRSHFFFFWRGVGV